MSKPNKTPLNILIPKPPIARGAAIHAAQTIFI